MTEPLPYKIAVLCYLFDREGRVLLLHRERPPNRGLYSPVGGKLEQSLGESPTACAIREIHEETGISCVASELHLTGIVSESGHESNAHWMMYLYEVMRPVSIEPVRIEEGWLGWHECEEIDGLAIPETDRRVIWPLFWKYRHRFFAAHIDCTGKALRWRLEQPACDAVDIGGVGLS